MKVQSPNHWTTREFPHSALLIAKKYLHLIETPCTYLYFRKAKRAVLGPLKLFILLGSATPSARGLTLPLCKMGGWLSVLRLFLFLQDHILFLLADSFLKKVEMFVVPLISPHYSEKLYLAMGHRELSISGLNTQSPEGGSLCLWRGTVMPSGTQAFLIFLVHPPQQMASIFSVPSDPRR